MTWNYIVTTSVTISCIKRSLLGIQLGETEIKFENMVKNFDHVFKLDFSSNVLRDPTELVSKYNLSH